MPAHRTNAMIAAAIGALTFSSSSVVAAGDPTGVWLNDTGRGAIEIKNCGAGLCGHVVWVKDQSDTKGCGRQILGNVAKVGAGSWDNGWIYSPEKKKKYDVALKPLANGTLQVTGYAGTKLFSKTMIWKRAPANLARCGSEETVAKADTSVKPSQPSKSAAQAKSAPAPKPDAKVAAKETAAKPGPKIIPPAPKPAERPVKAEKTPSSEPAPVDVARAEPVEPVNPAAKSAPAPADEAAAPSEQSVPQVHALPGVEDEQDVPVVEAAEEEDNGIDMGRIAKRLAEIERETGYGLKKTGNGNCRLNVPFATVNFPCRN